LVSIIIPHWRGKEILLRGLRSLREHTSLPHEIIVVDNGCDDGSVAAALQSCAGLRVVAAGKNLGFAGGCNLGMRAATGEYLALFNNDAVAAPHWLEPLVAAMENDPAVAACQPKILSVDRPDSFDYAGACGGFLDFLGYPFCRGRVFSTIEKDERQYDDLRDIFWASGACCLLRASALKETGGLDDTFFAHMEEIDLDWRLQLAGYRIIAVPEACVFHQAGSTLQAAAPRKTYLNHRNSLILLLKNRALAPLLIIFPIRVVLDFVEALRQLLSLRGKHAVMILRAIVEVALKMPQLLDQREKVQRARKISDRAMRNRFYHRSIVWDYFIRGRKKFSELPGQ
jgi:GT2 family glycosyltransferase